MKEKNWRRGPAPLDNDAAEYICSLLNEDIQKIEMLDRYNEEAKKRGWRQYNSVGSINNVLRAAGLFKPRVKYEKVVGKQIMLPRKNRQELAKMVKKNPMCLSRALRFDSCASPVQKKIRAVAMQCGGIVFDGTGTPADYIPDCISVCDHASEKWEFIFKSVVTLTVYGESAKAELVTPEGTEIYNDIKTVPQLMELQWIAEKAASKY